jgi:diguanylate cyclase (GGDEF)-like protein
VVRLFALAFVPFLAVGVLAAGAVLDAERVERDATSARAEALRLRSSIELHVVTIEERIATEALVAGSSLGLDARQMSTLLGFDVSATLQAARARVDEQRTVVGDADLSALDALRSRIGASDPSTRPPIDEVRAGFDRMHEASSTEYRRQLAQLTSADSAALADGASRQLLLALERLTNAYTASTWQLEYIGALLAPGPAPAPDVRRRLIEWTTTYSDSTEHLDETLFGVVRDVWQAGAPARSDTTEFARAVEAFVAGSSVDGVVVPPDRYGPILRSGIERNESMYRALDAAGDELLGAIDRARTAERDRLTRELAAAAAVVAVTMVLSYLTARSVVRPLLVLARRALTLRDGEIDGRPLEPRGPREVRVVTEAFNEAVANLATVEAVTRSLANGDTGAAAACAVPGGIGRTLRGAIGRLTDSLRERDELQDRLRHLAHHDALTGTYNRWGIEALLDERAARSAPPVAVLFVDLQGFRGINELLGHRTGDLVLQSVASRFAAAIGDGAMLARYGGDQWVVVGVDADPATATDLATRLVASLAEPVVVAGRRHAISCRIGIACTEPGEPARTTIRNADLALAEARRVGPGTFRTYDVSLRAALEHRRSVEQELAEALRTEAIEVHYQPVVDAATGTLRGVAALARWRMPGGGLRPPGEFVPVAEESDLIIDLDRFVLQRAAEDAARWRAAPGFEAVHVAVNVSARHLVVPGFVEHVLDVLDLTRLAPEALVLELTESVLLTDLPRACERLGPLRDAGVRVAIDDFGTGFTSVGQLRSLPIDVLKIDRSFIGDEAGPADRAIVPLVAQVGRVLHLEVVAEGVETEEQLRFVGEAGCELVQGFLTGRPVSAAVLVETFGIGRAECGPASSLRSATVVGSARPGHEPWSG